MSLIYFKFIATTLVAFALAYPFLNHPTAEYGVFATVGTIGWLGITALCLVFLTAVALYCRSLYRCLELIRPEARAANPKSVWLMFLIPYNFVEDFFIIHNVTKSLQAEAGSNSSLAKLKRFGAISGFGWCAGQILSLVPNLFGGVAGVVALAFWVVHWRFIVKVNKLLAGGETRAAFATTEG